MNVGLYKRKYRLGDLLVEYGLISSGQLEEALRLQRENNEKLGEILVQLGYVTKKSIHETLEFQLGIPFVDLNDYTIENSVIALVTETIVRKHKVIPVQLKANDLYLAMEDPLNIYAVDDVHLYSGKNVIPMLASEEGINKAIDIHYGKQKAMKAAEQYKQELAVDLAQGTAKDTVNDMVKSAPIVKLVNTVLEQAVTYRASDIHIEPYEKFIRVRFRVDGKLKQFFDYEIALLPAISARIKIMAGMDIAEKRKPQDGRISIKVDNRTYDIRVSSLPTVYGEKIVMRVNNKEGFNKGKGELGFFKDDLDKFDHILNNPYGIILVTGPTGSGKSTTLYTALNELNREDINIITVEDPVESQIKGINQVQVNSKIGLNFASALRSILRQDPDIIMIGEIRDAETADIAVKASITGHLVVSTIHTNDAPSTISRLVDMGVEPFLIAASVVGIIAQRLVRKLCPKCKERCLATEYEKNLLDIDSHEEVYIHKAKGCKFCNDTGYQGRIGVYEIMEVSKELRSLISKGTTTEEIRKIAIEQGMKSIKANASRLVLDGTTSIEELIRIAYGTN